MNASSSSDLKAQVQRLWDRGELLRDSISGESRFPLRLTLKTPSSSDITERFDAVRSWAGELSNARPLRLEWREVRHRVQGLQQLPTTAWIDSIDVALGWIGKRREWERFSEILGVTQTSQPALLAWLAKRPLQALALAEEWPQLLSIISWLVDHPRPAIHLRQVDLPGIHSKFIEVYRGVLTELLDLVLSDDAIDRSRTGSSQFAARFGFLEKPTRIRFRLLDPATSLVAHVECPDITLDSDSFLRLKMPLRRIFITENETNFLAFPRVAQAIVIFGAGYGWDALARCRWLDDCVIQYWGDIDTHGFAILDQLRRHFSHVQSFLMDRATLDAHAPLWGREENPVTVDLPRLTTEEHTLFTDLRDNRIRDKLRLEQEHVAFGWLRDHLETR
ncbi:MAG TPA: Wadjet anti-phage system protein JetD domain-containing protein [Dokdonella sp.]|uniref:DUF3322 domain-containing protein n=1 Tax=Dokdonella sp. TaxID=2291710 RepID=UPI002D7E1DCD|nr:Wadjet anti-phage system protein JetD domain-containing protein [Dokdonella sp.]HET9034507.1 Wadjet anti-phage system protein JetD domain-containing protein [Dokdonella sp.]